MALRELRRHRVLTVSAVVSLLVALIGFGLGWALGGAQRSVEAAATTSVRASVTVQERVLAQNITIAGFYRPGRSVDVLVPDGEGRRVVTRMNVDDGEALVSGDVLGVVSGDPLIGVDVEFSFYRDLSMGDSGDDARQLNDLLRGMGYPAGPAAAFTTASSRGIAQLYRERGLNPPRTSGAEADDAAAEDDEDKGSPAITPMFRHSHFFRLPAEESVVIRRAGVGDEFSDDSDVIATLRVGESRVVGRADIAQVEAFRSAQSDDTEVQVNLTGADESVNGLVVSGRVSQISEFIEPSDDDDEMPGYDITITPSERLELDVEAEASITLIRTGEEPTLVVPIIAVRHDAEGDHVLVIMESEDDEVRCDVTLGEESDGFVAVTSSCLRSGDSISVS